VVDYVIAITEFYCVFRPRSALTLHWRYHLRIWA
jgi:hypothetical protein